MANAIAHQVYVGIGSNVGNKKENFLEAVTRLAKLPDTKILKESSLYESEPLGDAKDWYVNAAIEIETKFKPDVLLQKFKNIERVMGRKKVKKRWGSRIIDPHPLERNRPTSHSPGARRDHLRAFNQREGRQKDSSVSRLTPVCLA